MKIIIVPVDESACSHNAARYAAALAQRTQASLLLYHAVLLPTAVAAVTVDLLSDEEVTASHLLKFDTLGRDLHLAYGVPVDSAASPAPLEEELPRLVEKHRADLVVMGMPRLNAFDNWLYGSTPTSLLRKATFPILIVPGKVPFQLPARVLFATDLTTLYQEQQLRLLKELVTAFEAMLLVLHVEGAPPQSPNTLQERAIQLKSLLEDVAHQYEWVQQKNVISGIARAIEAHKADLLLMIPHPHDFWYRLLNLSITRQMAYKTRIPLLLLPELPSANCTTCPMRSSSDARPASNCGKIPVRLEATGVPGSVFPWGIFKCTAYLSACML
ncbi:MAG: universal stress protein [Cytophagales bacterium]|nr:universal stress protein [Cytophagales bacterium]